MAFKMNGSQMHSGTAAHKSALKMVAASALKDTKPHTSGHTHDKPKIKWDKEKETSNVTTKNEMGGSDSKVTYETKGTSSTYTPPKKTDKGNEAYASLSLADRKKQDDTYVKANTKTTPHVKTRETSSTSGGRKKETILSIPPLPPKPLPVPDPKIEPVKPKKYRKPRKKKSLIKRIVRKIDDKIYAAKQGGGRRRKNKKSNCSRKNQTKCNF